LNLNLIVSKLSLQCWPQLNTMNFFWGKKNEKRKEKKRKEKGEENLFDASQAISYKNEGFRNIFKYFKRKLSIISVEEEDIWSNEMKVDFKDCSSFSWEPYK